MWSGNIGAVGGRIEKRRREKGLNATQRGWGGKRARTSIDEVRGALRTIREGGDQA